MYTQKRRIHTQTSFKKNASIEALLLIESVLKEQISERDQTDNPIWISNEQNYLSHRRDVSILRYNGKETYLNTRKKRHRYTQKRHMYTQKRHMYTKETHPYSDIMKTRKRDLFTQKQVFFKRDLFTHKKDLFTHKQDL